MRGARPLRALGVHLGAGLLRAGKDLTRLRVLGREGVDRARAETGAVIYAVWHGRFWLPAAGFGHEGSAILISLSEDGELIARIAGKLGYRTVRGSSSRRGSEGLRDLERELAAGHNVALTPDGPRGPRHVAQLGAAVLAARSGKPVVPVGAAARPAWTLGSWDAFQIPLPGARAAVVFGEPFRIEPAEDLEPARQRLEAALDAVERAADEAVGR
jgi:lysophospholipid acyltransferase (LPLAT)-like uncharacterized protein